MKSNIIFPTIQEVQEATRERLAFWCRFLPSPPDHECLEILNLIIDRFKAVGGFTPTLSKQIGWDNPWSSAT